MAKNVSTGHNPYLIGEKINSSHNYKTVSSNLDTESERAATFLS